MKIPSPRLVASHSASRRLFTLCATLSTSLLFAANGTWDGGGADANWTTLGNWTGDAAFPGAISGDTNADLATFSAAIATWGASGTPILIDSTSFNLKGITFDTAAGNYVIGTTNGNSIYLTSGGTIQMLNTLTNASAVETINAPLVIVGANGTYNFNNAKNAITSSLVIGGAISGGTAGNTVLTFDSAQGAAPNSVSGIISNGSATSLSLINSTGTWTYSGNNTYTGSTTVKAGAANFTGNYSGGGSLLVVSLPGTGTTANATITGDANFSGDVAITSTLGNLATLTLGSATSAGGRLTAATSVTLAGSAPGGARLILNNSVGNADRIFNTATVTVGYGQLTLTGNATADTTETIGGLVISNGSSTINITSAANRLTTLAATSLTRVNNGTLIVTGTSLGATTTNSAHVTFSTSPSAQLIGSGGAPATAATGTKNLGIFPWMLAGNSTATGFATYDTANGVRALAANEVQTSITTAIDPSSGETGDNVSIGAASETGITTKTVNSVFLAAAAAQTVTGAGTGNTLTISSGALAQSGAFTSTLSGFDTITFGNGEAVIATTNVNGTIVLNSSIIVTGNGGLTKSGAGTLLLGSANTFSGPTLIQAGTLQIGGTSGDLGTSSSIVINGTVAGSNTATLSIVRGGALSIGNVTGGGNLTQTDATSVLTVNQSGTGNTLNTVSGVAGSTLVFAGDGTGVTTINTALASLGQLIKITSGTINLSATRNIAANLEITGGIVNTRDNQTGFNSTTGTGTRTFTMSGGAFNILGTYGLSGFNSGGDATSTGYTGIFIGTQTGGILTIGNNDPSTRFTLGNGSTNTTATYTLSGGEIDALNVGGFQIGADVGGTSTATFNLSGGKLLVAATSSIRGASLTGAKQAFVWTGGTLVTYGYVATNLTSSAGTAVSSSTNTLVNGGGTLAPGDIGTVGRTNITGNYAVDPLAANAANAALAIDIGGTTASGIFQETPGSNKFDFLQVSSTAALGGQLNVSLVDNFAPTNGNTFKILTTAANGRSGTFTNTASANGGGVRVALADGLSSFKVTYNTADVTLGGYLTDNQWSAASASNWSDGNNWSAFTPSLAGHIAKFADAPAATGAVIVNLDADETVAGLQFDSTDRSYTLGSGTSHQLTLDNKGAASTISVANGTHTIAVPVSLNNNLAIATTGSTSALTLTGALSGTGKSITKTGTGALTFTAASTYTGGTTVSAGSLFVNNTTGSGTGTGALSVSADALLGGAGRIGGSSTVYGQLAPGATTASAAVLAFDGAVTFKSGSSTTIDINGSATRGTDFDGIDFNGALTIEGGALTFNITTAIADNTVLHVFGGTQLTANFTSVSATGIHDTSVFALNENHTAYTGSFGDQTLTLDLASGDLSFAGSAIPEPSTYAALAGAAALLGVLTLRRRRKE